MPEKLEERIEQLEKMVRLLIRELQQDKTLPVELTEFAKEEGA